MITQVANKAIKTLVMAVREAKNFVENVRTMQPSQELLDHY